ncbi:hypothetical protein J2S72_001003 [Peptoniphilus koenoeneniae]|uniref:SLH domain-containing protein n=1 Tax=Peptoniphilus koenoeneniae TaxID=507751 RepID=A0ABU0AUT5_9FIRM|nr:S-layer homology domain-containing protein [Peptoniphilus koenoeneniae]MDQ0274979.1 hypothetical protein [Peptoniphilus koenoeneniae]
MKKNKNFSKILSILLSVIVLLSAFPVSTFADNTKNSSEFTDVSKKHWAEKGISNLVKKGILKGYGDNRFLPDNKIKRSEFVSILNESFGFHKKANVKFNDVEVGSWYYEGISIAVGENYISGYPDGSFRPNANITRAETAMLLYKIFTNENSEELNNKEEENKVDLKEDVPSWAKDAIKFVISKGYMKGYPDGTFKVNNSITRAEVCSIINSADNVISKIKEKKQEDKKEQKEEKSKEKTKAQFKIQSNSDKTFGYGSKNDRPNTPSTPSTPSTPNTESNPLAIGEINENFYLLDLSKVDSEEKAKEILKEKYLSSDNYCTGKVFKDNKKVLLYAENLKVKCEKISQIPETIDGIYTDKNGEFVSCNDRSTSGDISLFVGNVKLDMPFKTSKYVLGLKGNKIEGALDLQGATRKIDGLNFYLEKLPAKNMIYASAISQSGTVKDNISDLEITNNSFYFGTNTIAAKNAIRIVTSLEKGYLKINNNTVNGLGADINGKNYQNAAISIITRTKNGTVTEIKNNKISNYGYHGIGATADKEASLSIENNILEGIGQNGIDISMFGRGKDINVKGNIVSKYGSKKIKAKKDFFGKEEEITNKFEVGLGINYIENVYGVKINGKYYSEQKKFLDELYKANTIESKEQNDKNEGVLNCTPIYLGQPYRFKNPIEEINKENSRLQNEELIIVKDDDKDLIIPDNKIKEKTVKSIKIVGNAGGKLVLNSNLKITDNLTIDLPNAILQNNANVEKDKVHIINIKNSDSSEFSIKPQFTNLVFKNSEDLPIEILNIKNSFGQEVTKEKSILTNNVKVFVNGQETKEIEIDDNNDKVIIKKSLLNTLTKASSIKLEYTDGANDVSKIEKSFDLSLTNASSIKAQFENKNVFTFFEKFAPDEGVKIKITEIKDASGKALEISKVNLNNLKVKVSYHEAKANDLAINGDTITVKKSFLDTILSSIYGKEQDMVLSLKDLDNKILDAKTSLKISVINNSSGQAEALSTLTFTQKNAPAAGMIFKIVSLKNSKGENLKADEIDLEKCVDVEPFPVDWKDDSLEKTEDGTIRFNRKYLTIDNENKTVTVKKEYLDKLQINDKDTEFGTKQIIIKYFDEKNGINFRSEKFIIHIKKALKALSNETKVNSNVYNIKNDTINSASKTIDNKTSVSEFIKNILKVNERQTLRVYEEKYIKNNSIDQANIYNYKKSYENIKKGDYLLVTAEDGKAFKAYKIILNNDEQGSLISIKDSAIVTKLGTTFVEIVENTDFENLKNALTIEEGAKISILDQSGVETEKIDDGYKLIAQKDNRTEERVIKIKYLKKTYRALIVANSDYGNKKLNLLGPVNDKKLMKKVFENQEINSNKFDKILVAENVKKAEFLEKIKEAFKGARSNDVSYLYYSGHGNNVNGLSYICTVDPIKDKESQTQAWVSVNELRQALDSIPGTKVLILDSCNAGGFIGKKVDAETQPTPTASSSRTSYAFNESVKRAFNTTSDRSVGYLTTNEYKVLTASSEDEFSFEDKKEGVGKFTKVLAQVAGINGNIIGDIDKNGKISLEEAYKYLEDNVVYTSHIQVFPRNDSYTLFEVGKNAQAMSSDTKISSVKNSENKDNLIIFDKGNQKLIKSGAFEITNKVTVEEFLKNIKKGHENQELNIIKYDNSTKIVKKVTDTLEKLDILEVTAEDGTKATYIITVKENKNKSDILTITSKKDEREIAFYTIIPSRKTISSSIKKITDKTSVKDFLSNIIKGDDRQTLNVIDKNQRIKGDTEFLAVGDVLLVKAENGSKIEYTINLEAKKLTLEFKDDAFKLEDMGGFLGIKILSNKKKLDNNLSTKEFLDLISNKEAFLNIKLNSGITYEPKKDDEKLEKGDYLLVSLKTGGFPQRYTLIVEDAVLIRPGEISKINFGDSFVVDHTNRKISSGKVKLTTDLTLGQFLSYLTNRNEFKSLKIKGLKETDKLKEKSILRIIAKNDTKNRTQTYDLIFSKDVSDPNKEIEADFGNDFEIAKEALVSKIKSKNTKITSKMTVNEFLSKLKNKDRFSEVEIKRGWDLLKETDTLKDGDKLQLTFKKSNSSLSVSETKTYTIELYKGTPLNAPNFAGVYEIGKIKKNEIISGTEKLTSDIKVKDFISKIRNASDYDSIKIQKAYEDNFKNDEDTIESDDTLILKKGDKEAKYFLRNVESSGISVNDLDDID